MFQPVLQEQRRVLSAAFMRGAGHSQGRVLQWPRGHTSLESQSTSQPTGRTQHHHSHVIRGFSVPRTYPSASSMGSGGAWREAEGRTVLVPRDTLSCSVLADREAMEMGCSRAVVMPVVTVRLWPEPLRVRSGVGRSGLRMLTRQKAEPLLGMKFTLFLSGQ